MSDQHRLVQLFGSQVGRLIPAGIKFGRSVYAPNVIGADPDTGRLADNLVDQMEGALRNMADVLTEAGASLDNVGRVTAYVTSVADRDPVYGPWDRTFPDAQDRPAFKVLVAPLPAGVRVRLDMLALSGARRKRIDIAGVSARDPTVVIGNWVLSSRVHGTDPHTGKVAEGLQAEVAQAFRNIDTLIALGGQSPRDITQLTLFAPDPANAQAAEQHFLEAFPDATQRPAFTKLTSFIPPHLSVMLEVIASHRSSVETMGSGTASTKVSDASSHAGVANPGSEPVSTQIDFAPAQADSASAGGAALREVFYRTALTPIPDAVCLDDLFFAPAIAAEDPSTGAVPDGFEAQLGAAFVNVRTCLASAGLALENVAHVTVYMQDVNWRPILNDVWADLFPDPTKRPPHKYVPVQFEDANVLAQLQVFAIRGAHPRVLEIPGMAHGDPMSMGAQTGNLLFSSRIVGTDTATGKMPIDPQEQANAAFSNVRTLLDQAGTSPKCLTQVTAFVNDPVGEKATLNAWQATFPSEADRPSLHFLNAQLPGNTAVRLEIIAAC